MSVNRVRPLPVGGSRRAGLVSRRHLVELLLVIAIAISYALVVTRGDVTRIVNGTTPAAATSAAPSHGTSRQPSGDQP